MQGITIDQLAAMCKKQQALGNGKKMVLMSSDDECNEYHQAWNGLQDGKLLKDYINKHHLSGFISITGCLSEDFADYVLLT